MTHTILKVLLLLAICIESCVSPTSEAKNEKTVLTIDSSENKKEVDGSARPYTYTTVTKPGETKKYFPFELLDLGGRYQINAPIESKELYPKYYDLFQKYGYEGNGYCWQGHITQILEKLDRELLKHIEFDPEAGSFFATADTKENQLRFAELVSPLFSDMKKLEEWVKKADRARIDD